MQLPNSSSQFKQSAQPIACKTKRAFTNKVPFHSFSKKQEGSMIIEFAVIAPVLLFFIGVILEYSLFFYATAVLEGSVTLSSRLAKTGFADENSTGVSREDMIYAMLEEEASVLLDISKIDVEALAYSDFDEIGQAEDFIDENTNGIYDDGEPYDDLNGNGQWDSDMGMAGLGGADDIVVYNVSYPWQIRMPFVSDILGDDNGVMMIRVSSVVKNEPWENVVNGS